MKECFIPFVEEQRRKLEQIERLCPDKTDGKKKDGRKKMTKRRAVLVVDGHKSRYDFETFTLLRRANIDLVILPAHSSHLTQPLDRKLNAQIKVEFRRFFNDGLPDRLEASIKKEGFCQKGEETCGAKSKEEQESGRY